MSAFFVVERYGGKFFYAKHYDPVVLGANKERLGQVIVAARLSSVEQRLSIDQLIALFSRGHEFGREPRAAGEAACIEAVLRWAYQVERKADSAFAARLQHTQAAQLEWAADIWANWSLLERAFHASDANTAIA